MRIIGESTGIIRIGVRAQSVAMASQSESQSESFCSLPTSHDHELDTVSSLDESLGEEGSSGSV